MKKIDEIFDKHWRENSYSLESDIKLMMQDYAEWYAKRCLGIAAESASADFELIGAVLGAENIVPYVEQSSILKIKLPEHD